MSREHKGRVGSVYQFVWTAPAYVDPTTVPVLTIRYASGDVPLNLAPLVAAAASISSVSGRVLTATGAPAADAAQGRYGAAFIQSDEEGITPVRVVKVVSTAITVADPLPRTITGGADTSLAWATWYVEVPTQASALRNVPWTVSYAADSGTAITDQASFDEGVIHWVRQPFSTGLTHDRLASIRPGLTDQMHPRSSDLWPLIEGAESELVAHVRANVIERGHWEDDIVGQPAGLAEVHADLAAALYYDDTNPARAEEYRRRALGPRDIDTGARRGGMLDTVLQSVPFDTDGDGDIDDARVRVAGPATSDVGGTYTASTAVTNWRRQSTALPYNFTVGGKR